MKLISTNLTINNNEKNLLIYGANSSGVLLFENLIDYNVIGFVDSDINKKGKKINNINIFHEDDLDFLLKSHNIFSIVISDIDLELSKKRELISKLEKYKVAVRILPNYDSILSKKFTFSDFKRVGIDELIDRKIILDRNKIYDFFNNQDILVTGAGGSIGSEISKQLIKMQPNKIILLDHSEYNLYKINIEINNLISFNKLKTKTVFILCSILDEKKIQQLDEYSERK